MDITKEPQRIISFCTGIQGLERGLKRAGIAIQPVCYVEIESFINENLVSGMEQGLVDEAPIWSNAKTFDGHPFRGMVHGFIGGYPCQPFSLAGQRRGIEDPRHLYPHLERHIRTVGPVWCFFENVVGHLTLGFPEVHQSLSKLGYDVEVGIFTAEEVGAPHKRERLFILAIKRGYKLAYSDSPTSLDNKRRDISEVARNGQNNGEELADTDCLGHPYREPEIEPANSGQYAQRDFAAGNKNELADSSGAERRPPIQTGFPQPNGDDGEWGKANGRSELCSENELGNAAEQGLSQPRLGGKWELCQKDREGIYDRPEQPSSSKLDNAESQPSRTLPVGIEQEYTEFRNAGDSKSKLGNSQHNGQPTGPQLRGCNEAGDRSKEELGKPCQPSGTDRPDDDKSLSRCKMADTNNSGSKQDRQPGEFWTSGIIQPSLNCGTADKGENHEGEWPSGLGQPQHPWESPRTVGFTDRLPRSVRKLWRDLRPHFAKTMGEKVWQETDRNIKAAVEPILGVTVDGYNFREDLLRAAGNSVVEQTAVLAFVTLLEKHNK